MSHTSNQTWDLHRGSNMMLPLTLPCRQAAKHWTSGTDNKQSCRRYRHEVGPYHAVESDVRSEICLHSEVTFPLDFSYRLVILCCHRMLGRKHDKTTSEESFVSLPTRLVQSELKKLMWDLDLDSSIGFPVTCAYLTMQHIEHLARTPGRDNKNPETSTDTTLIIVRAWEVGCQSWDVCLHVEVRFPLYLSYRHSRATATCELSTRWKRFRAIVRVRCQSVWHERNKKKQKTIVRPRYLRWNPISTDTILLSKCNIDQSIFCASKRTPDSMFPARVLTTIIANKCTPWKIQTISMSHC